MKREFDFNAKKSKLFMQYFYAMQKNNEFEMLVCNGSSSWNSEGLFEVNRDVTFEYNGSNIFVCWKILYNSKQELLSIENMNNAGDENFDKLLMEFLSDCYHMVINEKTKKYYKRYYYRTISGCNLAGEYWFKSFRFAPLFPDDDSRIINSERIVVLDMEVDAIDNDHANQISYELSEFYISVLSFIMDLRFEHEEIHDKYVKNDNHEMIRLSTQIVDRTISEKMPKKNVLCSTTRFKGSIYDTLRSTNQVLVCPKETRKIINGIEQLNEDIQTAIMKSCRLYRVAKNIGYRYTTAMLSYECAAVESIVKNMKYDSFSWFMTQYAGEDKELYDFIYSEIRSGHIHSGEFVFSDFSSRGNTLDDTTFLTKTMLIQKAHYRMRFAIIKWINEFIKF